MNFEHIDTYELIKELSERLLNSTMLDIPALREASLDLMSDLTTELMFNPIALNAPLDVQVTDFVDTLSDSGHAAFIPFLQEAFIKFNQA